MALTISDGTLTADLDQDGLRLGRGGWAQSGPQMNPDGSFADVEETLRLEWYSDDDDNVRAGTLQTLGQLDGRARRNDQKRKLSFVPPEQQVVVTAPTPTEAGQRYAIVRAMQIPKLDARHRASTSSPVLLNLKLLREGLWRGTRPGDPLTQVVAPTVVDATAGYGTANYVTIAPGSIPGDAPALTRISVSPQNLPATRNTDSNFYITLARISAPTLAELDAFEPFFWARDTTWGSPQDVSRQTIPGTQANFVSSGAGPFWGIWDIADPLAYNGRFHIYAIGTSAGTADIKFQHGWLYSSSIGEVAGRLETGTSPFWALNYLGHTQLPPTNLVLDVNGTYRILAELAATSGNLEFAGLQLVPAREQVMSALFEGYRADSALVSDTLVFDGDRRRTYALANGALARSICYHEGPYITLEPGLYNRIFVFHVGDRVSSSKYMPEVNFQMTVEALPRYQYLRG